jgi:hypothetical protein
VNNAENSSTRNSETYRDDLKLEFKSSNKIAVTDHLSVCAIAAGVRSIVGLTETMLVVSW